MDITSTLFHNCRNLLIESFEENPNYSFGDASLMIDHSIHVQEIAMNIAEVVVCNKAVVFIGSIFHDIGKTKMIDGKPVPWEVLRERHESFNYEVISNFLTEFNVSDAVRSQLQELFNISAKSPESTIIKDSDIIEFYMNSRLQAALKNWADKQNLPNELQRKADKFDSVLSCDFSKELALPYLSLMKKRWNLR